MTEMMNVNPLMDFARKTECSVKIPSQGLWYDDDNITFNAIGEVDIMPMLPNDEMKIVNPESLISGDAIISLIKSCCPGIKRPEELYYPDVNALLLGIRKATYGDDLVQQFICPKCWDKKNEIEIAEYERLIKEKSLTKEVLNKIDAEMIKREAEKTCAPIITELEKTNKILIAPQEIKLSIEALLAKMVNLPTNPFVQTKNGLKIYVTPYRCSDKIKFTAQQIKYQKITKFYEKEGQYMDLTDDKQLTPDFLDKIDRMLDMYSDVSSSLVDIVAMSIRKIELPNGELVDNKEYIHEYIKNCDVDLINTLKDKIDELNACGVQQTIPCECACCGHKWDEKFYGFNQSDFFGIGS